MCHLCNVYYKTIDQTPTVYFQAPMPSSLIFISRNLVIFAILMACGANLYSQQTDRLITVRKIAVKHDKIDEFIALQKEMSEV